jgi:uncharacterized lipoprotein YddW (UPF0748 family)
MRTLWRGVRGHAFILGVTLLAGCSMVRGTPPAFPPPSSNPSPSPSPSPSPERVRVEAPPPIRPGVPSNRNAALDLLPDEVRALWVVRTTLTHPDSIRVMVERAASAGFNTLLVQVRGRGDAYYQSRWEPRPPSVQRQGGSFDPLALVILEAHQRGISVHAWVNAHLVGGMDGLSPDPQHLTRSRPDLLGVPRELARDLFSVDPWSPRFTEALLDYAQNNRDRVEGMYTAPSHPEVK